MRRWFLFNCSTLVTPQLWLKQQPLTNLMHPNVCFNNTAQNNNRETKPQEDLEQDLPMMENPSRQQSSQNMENKINKINNYSLAFWNRYTSRRRGKNCYCVTPLVKKQDTCFYFPTKTGSYSSEENRVNWMQGKEDSVTP